MPNNSQSHNCAVPCSSQDCNISPFRTNSGGGAGEDLKLRIDEPISTPAGDRSRSNTRSLNASRDLILFFGRLALPEISIFGGAGCYTLKVLKVGRVTRPPFSLSIHLVPNNFTTLVVKGWGGLLSRHFRNGFGRRRDGSRRGRWAGRRGRFLWLWSDPSRQSPVSGGRAGEREFQWAIGFFPPELKS
jgi:hypothetical protein